MNDLDLQILRASVDSALRLSFADGEVVTAKIIVVSDEERDVIYDIAESNLPAKYREGVAGSAYRARFEEIVSVQRIEDLK